MTAGLLLWGIFWTLLGVQILSTALAGWRLRFPPAPRTAATPRIALLLPVCGRDPFAEETFRSAFLQDYPDYEILFCAASASDPAVPLVEALIAEHPERKARLLIGDERPTGNPKLNNLVKAEPLAEAPWLAMVDSNVLMPKDYLRGLAERADAETALVSSPPVGLRPEGFWGSVEAAFLNSFQARWQFLADFLGLAFAQGKTLFWRREALEAGGGFVALGSDLAEDVASTKLARRSGLKVRLLAQPAVQPIGERDFAGVWGRQLRWAKIRRLGFFWLYLPEILLGPLIPLLALSGLIFAGAAPLFALPAFFGVWYGVEWLLARANGWPSGLQDLAGMAMRDLLTPGLYVGGFLSRSISWRGNAVRGAEPKTGIRA